MSAPNIRSKKNPSAFSLVELLVVVAIIAVLSITAYTAFSGQTVKARDARRVNDLQTIVSALELYYVNEGHYPASPLVQGDNPDVGQIPRRYLSAIPTDPGQAGHDYIYVLNAGYLNATDFAVAATLEGEGGGATHRAHMVSNSDSLLIQAGAGQEAPNAVRWDGDSLEPCPGGTNIAHEGLCVPYNPNS